MTHPIAFYPTLVPLTGGHSAAVVLSQIMYWHQGRLRVQRQAQYWLAKSRAELCAETGITLDQYKRIMPLLARQGWIVLERHLFRNKVTPFIRLTDAGQEALRQHVTGTVSSPTNPLVSEAPNPLVAYPSNPLVASAPNPLTETTAETSAESTVCIGEDARTGGGIQTEGDFRIEGRSEEERSRSRSEQRVPVTEQAVEHTGWLMKATEILKRHLGGTGSSLGAFWKARVALVLEDGAFQKALTGKEQGQLKLLQKSLGADTRPVITYAVSHWWKFASEAGASAGVSYPADPQIGFLLKHHDVAMQLLHPPVPVVPPPMPPVQLIAPTPEEPVDVKKIQSLQELADLIEGLKSP